MDENKIVAAILTASKRTSQGRPSSVPPSHSERLIDAEVDAMVKLYEKILKRLETGSAPTD